MCGAQNVQDDLGKIVYSNARTVDCTFSNGHMGQRSVTHGSGGVAVRRFVAHDSVGTRVCMDPSTVRSTHKLVVHGLNFLWLIGSCG